PAGTPVMDTRWSSMDGDFVYCSGDGPSDDVGFLKEIIKELEQELNIDPSRIYMVGFSSGAQMAYRCAVEMGDQIAAVVESGASHYQNTSYTTQRDVPITFQLGNMDETWVSGVSEVPMELFDSLLNNYYVFQRIIKNHTESFHYQSDYSVSGDTTVSLTARFDPLTGGSNREFKITLINGLEHKYPNTVNHPMNGAEVNWEWLRQFSL
ncbi:MAG: hypothetical protein D6698_09025, partial [Gammaproteobacteria bacterium]